MHPIIAGFFDAGQPGYYLLILVFMAALVGLYLWGNRRRDQESRAARLGRLYKELDEEKLAAVPDSEVVEAVVANLLEKQDRRRPDPYHTIPLLSRGRAAVYSVWLICKELDKGSFEDLYTGPSAVFDELAADGLELVGAPAVPLRSGRRKTKSPTWREMPRNSPNCTPIFWRRSERSSLSKAVWRISAPIPVNLSTANPIRSETPAPCPRDGPGRDRTDAQPNPDREMKASGRVRFLSGHPRTTAWPRR